MSKMYKNQASGINVISGKIKNIAEDRMVMTVTVDEYDKQTKSNNSVDVKVSTGVPYDENCKAGYSVTVVGYPHGKGVIAAESVMTGNDAFETQELAIVTGLVKFARLNEEKNEDGTPKMKQDGKTPRKPHYDVTISVNEGDRWVDHIIKVYEGKTEEGKRSPLEIASAAFSKFDKENNRIRATFVTAPGQYFTRSYTGNDGKEHTSNGCSHMGYRVMDLEYIDQKEKTQNAPQAAKTEPAQDKQAQTQQAQPQSQPSSGFEASMDMSEEELFH